MSLQNQALGSPSKIAHNGLPKRSNSDSSQEDSVSSEPDHNENWGNRGAGLRESPSNLLRDLEGHARDGSPQVRGNERVPAMNLRNLKPDISSGMSSSVGAVVRSRVGLGVVSGASSSVGSAIDLNSGSDVGAGVSCVSVNSSGGFATTSGCPLHHSPAS